MDTDFQTELAIRVEHAQSAARVPSLTLAVGVGGMPFAVASTGYADVEHDIPATGECSYRIGSVTKTFTAAVTLLLAYRGQLDLDATVSRYLPTSPFGRVSLRMLLSHSSGLQREAPVDMWETMKGPSAAQLRESFDRVEMVAEPGQRWHYSNLGYAILGQIVEQVTGQSCESLIEQTLLVPLDLAHTSWTPPPSNAAIGYRLDPYIDAVHREPVMDQAAIGVGGQMWSTPSDLLRWAHVLGGGEPDIVPLEIVDNMHTLQVMVDTAAWTRGWGLGLILERRGERILAGHTGAMPGFQSALFVHRPTGVAVTALTNATRGIKLVDLAAEIVEAAIAAQPPEPAKEWRPAPSCPEAVLPILGSWWSEADETVFRWQHDGLHASLATDPISGDTLFVEEGPGRFRAVKGRLEGELLVVSEMADGIEMRWATYPLTRTPR
ncbi:serine hydrolase domain-containing protein [Nocardia pseudovaccinii]|uniref:serine hydrolase domain-containing protein n=1 Tax=Nocardia pseudovaccinii TaxID=189540 RepID=UPI0007A453DD|nr:serine hydrolase domain-containing protein [Nocardia pseudovaccinii]